MTVDNFDEAYQLFEKHGFKNFYKDKTVDTKTSRSAVMIAPTGYTINLIQHIKD